MTYPIAFALGWGCATLSISIGVALWEMWRPIHRNCIPKPENVETTGVSEFRHLNTSRDAIDVLGALMDAINSSGDPLSAALAIIEELDKRGLAIVARRENVETQTEQDNND